MEELLPIGGMGTVDRKEGQAESKEFELWGHQ